MSPGLLKMSTMKAVRYHGQRDIRLDDVPVPECPPGSVKIAIKYCGICGTDLHEYLHGPKVIPKHGLPHIITGEGPPVIIGHEFSGTIEEVGEGVKGLKTGDRVCIQPLIYDGNCRACIRGMVNCCDKNGFLGISGHGGGLSQWISVPMSYVKLLPPTLPLELGALVEPLAVAWHAIEISPYKDGDSALVLGGGPIGLSVVQVLVAKGCQNIVVSETSTKRREFAKQFGAHHVVNPMELDLVPEVERLTDGQGVDIAFDAAGVQNALDAGLRAVKARGTVLNIALWEDRASLKMSEMIFRERNYMAT
jgi:2-desacetyl-2-hydroxyethyl bacteriochlorophyllide A dehydrogenase